ncbi:RED-like protein N-terminal region-domain-containing protein [Thamnidium elegans]|nr:RED-like protein N-terminal region-domain-containing protein [Thamnidium elegans]
MSEGLSQEDFRKLMATPRRPDTESTNTQFKAPAPKSSGAIFAKPHSLRKKNTFKKKKPDDNEEEDSEEEDSKSNYRDRAAERRQHTTDPTDDSQLSTEELLQRTQIEAGQELDAKQLYEQSKFLGGDVTHTHLVKGLDFALLRKVRTDLEHKKEEKSGSSSEEEEEEEEGEEPQKPQPQPQQQQNEEDIDLTLEKFERGEKVTEENQDQDQTMQETSKFLTVMAKNIHDQIIQQTTTKPRVELFQPGRMAFVFELADEVGHYSDAFAIPTAIIRSKADITAKLSNSGWSEDSRQETSLVIDKISQVMQAIKRGDRGNNAATTIKPTIEITSQPVAVIEDSFMGDIFADVGRDYQLDETTSTNASSDTTKNYFQGLVQEEEDVEMTESSKNEVNALLTQATNKTEIEEEPNKRRKYQVEVDADAADIDMFGLSSSALPTSFEEHQSTAYQSDDEDEEKDTKTTQFVDQGTNRNKKAQLTRWDFDTEEEWQKYKSTIEIHPKSAFQFGVKLGDGRKRNRERKGMNDKQRLDRDYQQVKNIMSKKYGKSLDN